MRVILPTISVLLVLCVGVPAQEPDPKETKEYRDGYKQGVAEAEKELKEGHPTVYTAGGLRLSYSGLENLDKETGLLYTHIASCVVNDQTAGRQDGHNAKIHEYIKVHGLPAGSFKKWEKDLFDLKEYFNAKTKTDKPVPLVVGGRKYVSPDGEFTVTPVQSSKKLAERTMRPALGIVVAARGKKPMTGLDVQNWVEADFVWGPAGSRFIVLRGRNSEHYMALDLERSQWLRWEAE